MATLTAQNSSPPVVVPLPPVPTISKSLLEQVTGCKVLTYLIEDGSKPGDNWMSVIYTITAEVIPPEEGSTQETRHYLFKCYPRHPGRQVYLNKTNMFYNELCFYSIWGKALTEFQTGLLGIPEKNLIFPAFPPFIGGNAINYPALGKSSEEINSKTYQPIDNFIALTDLRKTGGYRMMDSKAGLDFEHVRLAVLELAKMHALSWAYRQKVEWNVLEKFPFLMCPLDPDHLEMWGKIVRKNVQIAVKTMDDALGPDNHLSKSTVQFEDKVEKIIDLFLDQTDKTAEAEMESWELHRQPPVEMVKASENEKLWRVICHGDTWCNNLLFKHDQKNGKPEGVILVDFQLTREGCPTADLVYLIYTSTTTEFRRQYLQKTLQVYHDQFNKICKSLKVDTLPDFNLECLKIRFHRSKLVGYMLALTTFPMMLKESKQAVNLDSVDENTHMDDMFIEAFGEGAGGALYRKRILEIANELYDEGVI